MKFSNPNLRAPIRRDGEARPIGSARGDTVCWFPRNHAKSSAVNADGISEHQIRCGFCLGCRRFEQRRLTRRLGQLFSQHEGQIWTIEIQGAPERLKKAIRSLHRASSVEVIPGHYKLGSAGTLLIALGSRPTLKHVTACNGLTYKLRQIRRPSAAKAWRLSTRGMLIERDEYGEQTNRFYHRGLPPAEKLAGWRWARGGIRSRHSGVYPHVRAWRDGVGVYRPDEYAPLHLVDRERRRFSGATKLEPIGGLFEKALDVAITPTLVRASHVNRRPPAGGRLSVQRDSGNPTPTSSNSLSPLNSNSGGGYASSNQSESFKSWADRMIELARARGRPPDGQQGGT